MFQAALYGLLHIALAQQAAPGVVAYQGLDGLADMHQLWRVAEQLHIARVPGHQPQLRVHHHHALRQMLQAARKSGIGLLGGLDNAVLCGAQLLCMLVQHGLQFLAAALSQGGQALALADIEHQQRCGQPQAASGHCRPVAGCLAMDDVVQQV